MPAQNPSRRGVVRTAIWTTPVVLAAAPAPVFAASACDAPTRIPSAANGWTVSNTNMQSNGTNGFNGSGYTLSSDPNTGLATVTVTSPSYTFRSGRTYTFSYAYSNFVTNERDLILDVRYAGASIPALAIDTDITRPTSGTKTASLTPPVTVSGPIVFAFSFPATPAARTNGGDDITLTSFSVTCA